MQNAPLQTIMHTNDEPLEAKYEEMIVKKTVQTEFIFEASKKVQELTPEIMHAKIDELGYSIRKAAEEIGISHTILSRYLAHKIKRYKGSSQHFAQNIR